MINEDLTKKLDLNPSDVSDEAVRLLIIIADNILNNPSNTKARTLNKFNPTISKKIIATKGAVDCLKLMGFQETEVNFIMPTSVQIKHIEAVKQDILRWKSSRNTKTKLVDQVPSSSTKPIEKPIQKIVLPPLNLTYSNPFLTRIEKYFHNSLSYENKEIQERAKALVPLQRLEEQAKIKLRTLQEQIKKNKMADPELSVQDMLILELLAWFKEDFFTWVDSPDCFKCGGKTQMSHMSTDPKLLIYTDRVELHRCDICKEFTPFPRYNDLNILLETRKGRCGEWANTFTLLCRAMGWDTRFIVDEGDHVWTEVYSITQKRWLHCDPCENICDSPLVYEIGWKKRLSYIMAYSVEEIQDVTWRYSSNHKEVLTRRKNCTEKELLDAIITLRSKRQKTLSESRRSYITKRLLNELIELLTEKKPSEHDGNGRISGSSAWRLARGETENVVEESSHVWLINNADILENNVIIRYSTVLDKYEYLSGGNLIFTKAKWNCGAFKQNNINRKVETDWKKAYLCRKEGSSEGTISWKFDLKSETKVIDSVDLTFENTTFKTGNINVQICSDDACVSLPTGQSGIFSKDFSGLTSITITANLSGGEGDIAWQHVQLFRQDLTDEKVFLFKIKLTFKNKN